MTLKKAGPVIGSASADGHKGHVELETIRWGEENTGLIGGKGGNLSVRNFEFTKGMCPASMQLLLACASGDPVKEAIISCRGTNVSENIDFLTWTLGDGVVCLYEMHAAVKESVIPTERVCIRFRTLAAEFKPRIPDDKVKGGMKLGAALTASLDVGQNTFSSGS